MGAMREITQLLQAIGFHLHHEEVQNYRNLRHWKPVLLAEVRQGATLPDSLL